VNVALTYIDTDECRKIKLPGRQGTVAEIVSRDICGAKNVIGLLRWLGHGESFEAGVLEDKHQLIYVIEGEGVVTLTAKEYSISKGDGVYLAPTESAGIRHTTGRLELFHLVVTHGKK
jgi:glyoxylate utilization-related uncharacterized protein